MVVPSLLESPSLRRQFGCRTLLLAKCDFSQFVLCWFHIGFHYLFECQLVIEVSLGLVSSDLLLC